MLANPLRKLTRVDLAEIILQQEKTIEELESRNSQLQESISSPAFVSKDPGSLAAAANEIMALFEQTQEKADRLLQTVQKESADSDGKNETESEI